MPQAKLIKVEETDAGIKLTFLGRDDTEFSGIYDNAVLSKDKLEKMIGYNISYANEQEQVRINKAWDTEGKPSFSNDECGYDR